jgi:VWFA-related protein
MLPRTTLLLTLLSLALGQGALAQPDAVLWPEPQRAFLQDGPALLLEKAVREQFSALDEQGREDFIASLEERHPGLAEAIEGRWRLVRQNDLSPLDDRARLLFLRGLPASRQVVDCGTVFRPTEIWDYDPQQKGQRLILFQPGPGEPYRLWIPLDSKRVLYTESMEYFLDQWEELQRFITGRRFDKQLCKEAQVIDKISGVEALTGYRDKRPSNQDFLQFLAPPTDLQSWIDSALATAPAAEKSLQVSTVELQFPALQGPRMVSRIILNLPPEAQLGIDELAEPHQIDVSVEGILERGGKIFDRFRVRFNLDAPEAEQALALVLERSVRPKQEFLLRLKVTDEIGGGRAWLNRGFAVPAEAEEDLLPSSSEDLLVAVGKEIAQQRMVGVDSLVLVPPDGDVVIGLWRAEALITGERIVKVVFLVDGKSQLTRSRPPFSAEVRLSAFPTEQVVRAEGYDAGGELVASDEIVLNQPRGALRVRFLEPKKSVAEGQSFLARVEVVVPEERRVEKVEFVLNEQPVKTLELPPWEAQLTAPAAAEISYLTAVATLDDGTRAEDVKILNNPDFVEQVDVNLVELFATVTDSQGILTPGLAATDFEIFEDGHRQEIAKFELVENLPLTVGITIDTSGSMSNALYEAQKAAAGFLENIVTRRDRCFAISFSDRPVLLMPPTNDVEAVKQSLEGLGAIGFTALHDALVHSLYYFRGVRGRKALILLSDGDDTASHVSFREALEYARHSGVVIYTIGLGVGGLNLGIRNKLKDLSSDTGGRSFFISKAEELLSVYKVIEAELRSQYLLAYASNQKAEQGTYRTVEVKVKKRGYTARTARGYYE